jgi:hypothetical protein
MTVDVAVRVAVAIAIGVVLGFVTVLPVAVDSMIVALSLETALGLEECHYPLDDFFESFF